MRWPAAPSEMPISAQQAAGYCRRAGYHLKDISAGDVIAVETLPRLQADPFDRIVLAPALAPPLRLVTHDPTAARYSGAIIRV
jgi:PIN domain nuclease of toxin-antitoxin system